MKRRSVLSLVFFLILCQLFSSVALISASAASYKQYIAPAATGTVTLDGVANDSEGWGNVPWSNAFEKTFTYGGATAQSGFSAKLKALWKESDSAVDLYLFVEVHDATVSSVTGWKNDGIWFLVNDGTTFYTSTIEIGTRTETTNTGNGGGNGAIAYAISDHRATDGVYTAEARYRFKTPADSFKFDVLVQDNRMESATSADAYVRYAWGNVTQNNVEPLGICKRGGAGDTPGEKPEGDYDIYRAEAGIMTVDGAVGTGEVWDLVPWTDPFTATQKTGVDATHPVQDAFAAKMKMLWSLENDTAYLWFLTEVTDATVAPDLGNWLIDYFGVIVDEDRDGTKDLSTAALYIPERAGVTYPNFTYKITDRRATGNGYTIEGRYTFKSVDNCTGTVKLDFLLNDNVMESVSDTNRYVRYSWMGITDVSQQPSGVARIQSAYASSLVTPPTPAETDDVILKKGNVQVGALQKDDSGKVLLPDCETTDRMIGWYDEAAQKLYPVGAAYTVGDSPVTLTAVILSLRMVAGASVRMTDPTAIRFAFDVSESIDSLTVTEKGILLADSSLLTNEILSDHLITAAELTEKSIAFEAIPATAEEGNPYRMISVKENVTDKTVRYAASGYVTVRYADESTKTFFTTFDSLNNVRSLASVAQKAYGCRSNLRTVADGINYSYRVSSAYAIDKFTSFSYSPFTERQLDILKALIPAAG